MREIGGQILRCSHEEDVLLRVAPVRIPEIGRKVDNARGRMGGRTDDGGQNDDDDGRDSKMSQLLRHDGLMVLFVRRTPFRADRRDSRDVQECGMCDLQCGTGISGKGCGTL